MLPDAGSYNAFARSIAREYSARLALGGLTSACGLPTHPAPSLSVASWATIRRLVQAVFAFDGPHKNHAHRNAAIGAGYLAYCALLAAGTIDQFDNGHTSASWYGGTRHGACHGSSWVRPPGRIDVKSSRKIVGTNVGEVFRCPDAADRIDDLTAKVTSGSPKPPRRRQATRLSLTTGTPAARRAASDRELARTIASAR
jgi:hypothetical protein